jgi:hypothetical protein
MQCVHQSSTDSGIEWIERCATTPPPNLGRVVGVLPGPFGKRRECSGIVLPQTLPLFFDPSLEVDGVWNLKAIEKGPRIFSDRAVDVATGDRVVEPGNVRSDDRRIQTECCGAFHEFLFANRAAQSIQRLRQHASGGFLGAVRPQAANELLAADAEVTSDGQLNEHRERPSLNRRSRHRDAKPGEGNPAKRAKLEGRTPFLIHV